MMFGGKILVAGLFITTVVLHAESVAGLKWTPPSGWKSVGTQTMRAATYPVPAAAGGKEGGECVVYFFGKDQGGSIDANLQRWKSQFQTPDGKPAEASIKVRSVNGIAVNTIDASGSYTGMGGPVVQNKSLSQGYRLLGAIFVNPEGNIFLKFTGPRKTVTANEQRFEQLLTSFSKQ
ncbi:MAG: hypothetical protein ABL967_07575 [Bryobacteraceae bacterium]